jgi:hypothetical protein
MRSKHFFLGMRLEVLMALNMKSSLFWALTPCSMIDGSASSFRAEPENGDSTFLLNVG